MKFSCIIYQLFNVLCKLLVFCKDKLPELINKNGIDSFYNKISSVTVPNEMWKLVNSFSASIDNVGPALACDFFKEMGFTRYVKVDHHFKKQFPQLLPTKESCKHNSKESFLLSQTISDEVGITPFHLDSILYLWGRYGIEAI